MFQFCADKQTHRHTHARTYAAEIKTASPVAGVKVMKRKKLWRKVTHTDYRIWTLLCASYRRTFTIRRDSQNSAYAADTNGLLSTKLKRSVCHPGSTCLYGKLQHTAAGCRVCTVQLNHRCWPELSQLGTVCSSLWCPRQVAKPTAPYRHRRHGVGGDFWLVIVRFLLWAAGDGVSRPAPPGPVYFFLQ